MIETKGQNAECPRNAEHGTDDRNVPERRTVRNNINI